MAGPPSTAVSATAPLGGCRQPSSIITAMAADTATAPASMTSPICAAGDADQGGDDVAAEDRPGLREGARGDREEQHRRGPHRSDEDRQSAPTRRRRGQSGRCRGGRAARPGRARRSKRLTGARRGTKRSRKRVIIVPCRWTGNGGGPGPPPPALEGSDGLGVVQLGDLLLRIAELGQDVVGVLTQQRRGLDVDLKVRELDRLPTVRYLPSFDARPRRSCRSRGATCPRRSPSS